MPTHATRDTCQHVCPSYLPNQCSPSIRREHSKYMAVLLTRSLPRNVASSQSMHSSLRIKHRFRVGGCPKHRMNLVKNVETQVVIDFPFPGCTLRLASKLSIPCFPAATLSTISKVSFNVRTTAPQLIVRLSRNLVNRKYIMPIWRWC